MLLPGLDGLGGLKPPKSVSRSLAPGGTTGNQGERGTPARSVNEWRRVRYRVFPSAYVADPHDSSVDDTGFAVEFAAFAITHDRSSLGVVECPAPDLNRDSRRNVILNHARLPISPAGHLHRTELLVVPCCIRVRGGNGAIQHLRLSPPYLSLYFGPTRVTNPVELFPLRGRRSCGVLHSAHAE